MFCALLDHIEGAARNKKITIITNKYLKRWPRKSIIREQLDISPQSMVQLKTIQIYVCDLGGYEIDLAGMKTSQTITYA